jgi:hypothetical protein
MQVSTVQWSSQQREIAQAALKIAYERETLSLIEWMREKASEISQIDDIWRLNDYLSARRFDIDGKYDDREDELLFVLAKLLKEGWLTVADLDGLESAQLTKLKALTRVL